ncbi:hypothetical protein ONE63_001442 [Megalurothrips usitatus]|uniref:Uncharacterized protein n=1 Tax=Megalurothrips usitatus TaxID=439358 RepID=A0AAV7XF86_9NEOP|nr:hypothetical protein ONE63_001442 [Megalurothrips usitatus]
MDRPRQAAPYRLQVSRPLLHAYTISDGSHEPVVGYALPMAPMVPMALPVTKQANGGMMPAMAATSPTPATPNNNNNNNKFVAAEPEEDIAAIAKQISDHAEAIYQTWKSRGLAPAEILTMPQSAQSSQAMEQLVNKFVVEDKARQAALNQRANKLANSGHPLRQASPSASPALDLLDDGGLDGGKQRRSPVPSPAIEQLVSSFVSEDKARLAAQQQQQQRANKSLPSSIQFALQKFESKQASPVPDGRTSPTVPAALSPAQPTRITPNKAPAPLTQQPPLHHQEIFLETIETSFPEDLKPQAVRGPGPPAPGQDAVDGTWPLKHKAQRAAAQRASEYLDEVAREEERLINALKTGIILAEDPAVNNNKAIHNNNNKKGALEKDSSKGSPVKKAVKADKPAVDMNGKPSLNGVRQPHSQPHGASPANKVPHPAARPRQPHAAGGPGPANAPAPHSPNPVRPFLTRGSVAERVLIFEKCPTELLLDSKRRPAPSWRAGAPQGDVQARAQ